MRNLMLTLLLAVCGQTLLAQGAPPQGGANQPYTLEYYYKVQWGRQQEFLQLFLKNHYPLLKKNVESGRMISVEHMIQQLWPDQATYKREEQRRFEILLAHWDLPVSDITPR